MFARYFTIRRFPCSVPAVCGCLWVCAGLLSGVSAQTDGGIAPDAAGGLPGVPGVPGYPPISNTPTVPGTAATPGTPGVPGYPPIPGTPGESGTPAGVPAYTDAASAFATVPGVPDPPGESDPPGEPDLPDESGPSGKPGGTLGASATGGPFGDMLGSPLGSVFGDHHRDGFSMSAKLTGTYDSNVTRTSQPQDDFLFGLGGDLSYLSKGSPLTFGANYRGRYDQYFNLSDFSGYIQGGGLVANYKSGRITATATAGYDSNRGSPQNYQSGSSFGGNPQDGNYQNFNQGDFKRVNMGGSTVVNYEGRRFSASLSAGIDLNQGSNSYHSASSANIESTNIHAGLSARYRLSKDITLTGNVNQNSTTSSGGGYGDTNDFTLGASALWRYSALTEFGPGIRYTSSSGYSISGSDSQLSRTSIGPTITLNYKASRKVSLTSQVGMDFSKFDSGQSADPTFSGSLALNYQASRLWGMSLSWSRDTRPDYSSPNAFYTSNSLRLGCHRKIHRATLNLGVSYLTSSSVVFQGVTGGRPDSNSLSLDSTLSMPVFANTCNASVFARYNDQSGVYSGSYYGNTGNSWNSFQMGFSISRSF